MKSRSLQQVTTSNTCSHIRFLFENPSILLQHSTPEYRVQSIQHFPFSTFFCFSHQFFSIRITSTSVLPRIFAFPCRRLLFTFSSCSQPWRLTRSSPIRPCCPCCRPAPKLKNNVRSCCPCSIPRRTSRRLNLQRTRLSQYLDNKNSYSPYWPSSGVRIVTPSSGFGIRNNRQQKRARRLIGYTFSYRICTMSRDI